MKYLLILTIVLASIGTLKYAHLAFTGRVKPNSISWFFWFFLPLISLIIMYKNGVTILNSTPLLLATVLNFIVFIISVFVKNATWKVTRQDIYCAAFAFISIFFWLYMANSVLALLFAILGDMFSGMPTLYKAYKFPESESISSYISSIPNLILTIILLPEITFINSAYVFWILFSNFLKTGLILRSKIYSRLQ